MLQLFALKYENKYLSMVSRDGWSPQLTIDCLYSESRSILDIMEKYPGSKMITFKLVEVDERNDD